MKDSEAEMKKIAADAQIMTNAKSEKVLALEAMIQTQLAAQSVPSPSSVQHLAYSREWHDATPDDLSSSLVDQAHAETSVPGRSLRVRAIDALSRREYSRQELARKLAGGMEVTSDLEALLDELQNKGYLSEARYVESRLNVRQARYGAQKILQELRAQGLDESLLREAESKLQPTELVRARAVWEKKFSAIASNSADKAKQWRYLQSRGFATEIIRLVVSGKES